MVKSKVAIVTDSTACIPPEIVEKYPIELVPIEFILDGKTYRDGIDITPTEFYTLLRQAEKLPTTSGSLPGPFLETYRRASQRAKYIFCITESSKLSGMYNSARVAAVMAKKALRDVTIALLECSTAAAGQGLVALAAAKAAISGKSLVEVTAVAESMMPKVYLFATLDTLHYLVKGGRVPKVAALAGSLLQIKPIFTVIDGEARPVTNVRTSYGALKHILKLMEKHVIGRQSLHVAIMHADSVDRAQELRGMISTRFNCSELFITEFTPVMGVHTGPGVIGVAFYGD
jgi:DegV family protein with EDD domain